jgi:hypothetical protein
MFNTSTNSSTTHITILPVSFSVGYVDSKEANGILENMQKLDAYARVHKPFPNQLRYNTVTGKKSHPLRFHMLVEHGQEKRLFFKMKLKYGLEFKRHYD